MKKTTKPIIAFIMGLIIVLISQGDTLFIFIGMVLVAIGIIDLAWITIQPPKPKKVVSKTERKETLRRIKKAVKKRR